MTTPQIVDTVLVFLGFIIFTIAILLDLNLIKNIKTIEGHIDKITIFMLSTYIVIMGFFLTCYSFIGASLIHGVDLNDISTIGVVLFSISIFVCLDLFVQMRLIKCISESKMQLARSLISAIETRDANLEGHSLHVREIATLIFDNLPKDITEKISRHKFEYASLMHDLGKFGISEEILNKPSELTQEEWSLMKEHPRMGVQIIEDVSGFDEIKEWILYHHERMDGNGYYGLKGNEIPIASRIMSIADAYSAIVMDRSYRKAKEHDEAIEIMLENSGTQFDPELLDVFKNIKKSTIVEKLKNLWDGRK
ncbi:MAG: HD domain-containing protein [Synergistaceae bacterium]|nr:HD domain-containing protein [Synergistaceae bacterium]